MSDVTFPCPKCGATLRAGTRFCGSCGEALPEREERRTAQGVMHPAPGRMGRTMIGLPAAVVQGAGAPKSEEPEPSASAAPDQAEEGATAAPAEAPEAPPAAKPAGVPKHTMLGVAPGSLGASPNAGAVGAAAGQPGSVGAAAGQPGSVGAAAGQPGGGAAAGQPGGPQSSAASPFARTVVGVSDHAAEQAARPPAIDGGGGAQAAGAPPPPARSAGGRTMLGLPAVGLPPPGAPAPAASAAEPISERPPSLAHTVVDMSATAPAAPPAVAPAADHGVRGRTMLGVGLGESAEPAAAPQSSTMPAIEPRQPVLDDDETGDSTMPPAPRRGAGLLLVGVLALIVVGGGALAYATMMGRPGGGDAKVSARVIQTDDGEAMQFEVPGAPEGSKLRFGGQEQALEAGRASFPLAADSLRVGENVVLVEVISPDGAIDSARITLEVDYRVTIDTAPLQAGKPNVDVVVTARPGSKVLLDGQPLELDDKGRGVRTDELDLSARVASGEIKHVVRYRVEPPEGEPSVGELETRIPVTSMQIDKPGLELVTDRAQVEIAGAVAPGTRVSVDGKPIEVKDGRFFHTYALPELGRTKVRLEAVADGKAPNRVTIALERVADLAKAAQGFEADPSLTYAKIAQNPSIYRGQKVAFDARIYNLKVEGGQTVLQVLVRECPKGQACSLWVTYPAATDFTQQSWVRILGTVQGEQQFRSEQDKIQSVPKVAAAFLLPAQL